MAPGEGHLQTPPLISGSNSIHFFWDILYFGFNSHLPYVAAVPRPSGHHLDVDREDGVGSEIWTLFLRSTK